MSFNVRGVPRVVLVLLIMGGLVFLSALILGVTNLSGASGGEGDALLYQNGPFGEGLVLKNFQWCDYVDIYYRCINPRSTFDVPGSVSFTLTVESDVVSGGVQLVENYAIKDKEGNYHLVMDKANAIYFEGISSEDKDKVFFKNSFRLEEDLSPGDYILELEVENLLFGGKLTLEEEFSVEEILPEDPAGVEYQ